MTPELTIGAIKPGYGGLPIGVAAALGGASLAWYAHPGQDAGCPGRTVMRYHHPHAGAHAALDAIPHMVDVLTVNSYHDWTITCTSLIGAGYKPPLVIVETVSRRDAVPVCEYLRSRGYRAAWQTTLASDVGAPHRRPRVYVIAVRGDCQAPGVNAAYLDAVPWEGTMWPTPNAYSTHLDVDAYRWSLADLEGKADSRALEHWEKVTGERYPYPLYTLPTATTGAGGLSLGFVEWMMGLPVGYVSTPSLRLAHDQRMGLLYSGTVPLQAAHAVATGMRRVYQP